MAVLTRPLRVSEWWDLVTCHPALLARGAVLAMPLLCVCPGAAAPGLSGSFQALGHRELQWIRQSAPGKGLVCPIEGLVCCGEHSSRPHPG